MSWEVAKRCNERKFGSASRKQVIMFLADKASDDGEGVYCSKHSIAKFTELSLATVKRIIRDFASEGILVQTGERDCDFGYTNEYRICLEAVSRLDDLTKKKSDAQGGRQQTGVTKTPDEYDPASEVTTTPPPGSSRPPNHPKTIQKPPTRADTREAEDQDFEKAWGAYPADRRRNKTTCRLQFERAIEDGTTAKEFICAVRAYATETEGYTRSKVCFSDNWFRGQRWQRYVEEAREAQISAVELEEKHYRQLAGWVRERYGLCKTISRAQACELLARGLVSEPELRRAEVAW
ncbi:hypothetical protein [Phaeobacter sp. HF9A]|uniref:hypothetical protein n=1 Tax=Phaeobacter sp. HF9A TaxID=2721561 RepID=UPI00158D0A30|nr:hypothetical protein [Phaeobacter sp. HF9A]